MALALAETGRVWPRKDAEIGRRPGGTGVSKPGPNGLVSHGFMVFHGSFLAASLVSKLPL